MQKSLNIAGSINTKSHHVPRPLETTERPLYMGWISSILLQKTQRVWSREYGRLVTEDEAIEILTNVKHMAKVLLKAKKEALEK